MSNRKQKSCNKTHAHEHIPARAHKHTHTHTQPHFDPNEMKGNYIGTN